MISGPRDLAAYHAQVLESERKPHQKGQKVTRTENAELAELNMTPAQIEERQRKLAVMLKPEVKERRTARASRTQRKSGKRNRKPPQLDIPNLHRQRSPHASRAPTRECHGPSS